MNLEELKKKYSNKNEIIIKRKKGILEFTVKVGLIAKYDVTIYADFEKLCIGNTTIKMEDIKNICINKVKKTNIHYLTIIYKNDINVKSLNITTCTEEDLNKIGSLFDYFIFSNEKDYNRLISNDYEFFNNDYINNYECRLNEYNETQREANTIMINNKEYIFIKILPKSYYKKYLKKKYILFESKVRNSNYMDIWIEKNEIKKMQIRTIFLLIVGGVIFLAFRILYGLDIL